MGRGTVESLEDVTRLGECMLALLTGRHTILDELSAADVVAFV